MAQERGWLQRSVILWVMTTPEVACIDAMCCYSLPKLVAEHVACISNVSAYIMFQAISVSQRGLRPRGRAAFPIQKRIKTLLYCIRAG